MEEKNKKLDGPVKAVSGDAHKVTISADELLLQEPGTVKAVDLSATQKAGLLLAGWTGIIGAILVFLILGNLIVDLARLPANPLSNGDLKYPPATQAADLTVILDAYKSMNDTVLERSIKIFDAIITKTLLPIFTLLLGYIFGSRAERENKP